MLMCYTAQIYVMTTSQLLLTESGILLSFQ